MGKVKGVEVASKKGRITLKLEDFFQTTFDMSKRMAKKLIHLLESELQDMDLRKKEGK